jgi:hypothetical protein
MPTAVRAAARLVLVVEAGDRWVTEVMGGIWDCG